MNRIDKKFQELKKINKKALITFITAGYPSLNKTEELIYAQEKGGASIIEIGIPFSDPLADGPVIQKSSEIALKADIKLKDIFYTIERVRKNSNIPLVFLVYFNTILAYGIKEFINKCNEVGIDGLIIPDLPLEEQQEISPYIQEEGVTLIPLVAPTSKDRIKDLVENKKGFVYCISSLGVTGGKGEFHNEIEEFLKQVRSLTKLPLAVGFGISNKEQIDRLKEYVDGVIVGSAIIEKVTKSTGNGIELEQFVRSLNINL